MSEISVTTIKCLRCFIATHVKYRWNVRRLARSVVSVRRVVCSLKRILDTRQPYIRRCKKGPGSQQAFRLLAVQEMKSLLAVKRHYRLTWEIIYIFVIFYIFKAVLMQGYDDLPKFRRNTMLTSSRSNFPLTPTFCTPNSLLRHIHKFHLHFKTCE